MKFTVCNWREYDAALRARGSLTMWVTPEAIDLWAALPRTTRGGQSFYSDLAIEVSLMLRLVFRQPLRQTEGLMASIFELLGVDLKAPDHSTVSRRAMSLESISKRSALPAEPAHILIDSTGLKVFGAGEWLQEKHGAKARRSWRKLHLAVDASTGLIVASMLTEQDVDDPSQVGPLLDQIEHEIGQVTADGAYDGDPTYETIAKRDPQIQVVIPPRVTAQPSAHFEAEPTRRDTHLLMIQSLGRLGWQESLFWWVPIDDELHMQFSLHRVPVQGEAADRIGQRRQQRRSEIDLAHQDVCEQVLGGKLRLQDVDKRRVDLVRLQDDIGQIGQGRIANRGAERLGSADVGVGAVRRLWRREVGRLQKDEPVKAWERNADLVPNAWGLVGAPPQKFGLDDTTRGLVAVVDVRPFVEIDRHLAALDGATARSCA
ncbi:MAG: IS5 family transposase [Polaromonas sp.]|uniref:IS5 family transposase n=1 Tax=Polaromonas sp. TaxID=1869339 RepID=UPI002487948F|nr:IS5 family transposase [Polaromonas sp.]MDI1269231.1 IS5 family transposase [Polaromonas sp.]